MQCKNCGHSVFVKSGKCQDTGKQRYKCKYCGAVRVASYSIDHSWKATSTLTCPTCSSKAVVKAGFDRHGIQRYKCQECKRTFRLDPQLYAITSKQAKTICYAYFVLGYSMSAIAKEAHRHFNTIRRCLLLHAYAYRDIATADRANKLINHYKEDRSND